jgi:hypothetical protein
MKPAMLFASALVFGFAGPAIARPRVQAEASPASRAAPAATYTSELRDSREADAAATSDIVPMGAASEKTVAETPVPPSLTDVSLSATVRDQVLKPGL